MAAELLGFGVEGSSTPASTQQLTGVMSIPAVVMSEATPMPSPELIDPTPASIAQPLLVSESQVSTRVPGDTETKKYKCSRCGLPKAGHVCLNPAPAALPAAEVRASLVAHGSGPSSSLLVLPPEAVTVQLHGGQEPAEEDGSVPAFVDQGNNKRKRSAEELAEAESLAAKRVQACRQALQLAESELAAIQRERRTSAGDGSSSAAEDADDGAPPPAADAAEAPANRRGASNFQGYRCSKCGSRRKGPSPLPVRPPGGFQGLRPLLRTPERRLSSSGGVPWPPQPASGRPTVEDDPLATSRWRRRRSWRRSSACQLA